MTLRALDADPAHQGPLEHQLWQLLAALKTTPSRRRRWVLCRIDFDEDVGGFTLCCARASWLSSLLWWLCPARLPLGL